MSAQDQPERTPRILVVDDSVSLCKLISTILKAEGFEPFTVADAEHAIPTALKLCPDLILLDVMMPHLDGLEVCRRLRRLRQTRYTSVILVTARVSTADKVAGLRAGADDYLTKPFDAGELVERVRSTLRRSAEMKSLNPLTGLPGNDQIRVEMRNRLASGKPVALLHVDLDNFKAFNDHYGFLHGDEAIVLLSNCLRRATPDVDADGFVGHVGGDDFVVIVPADLAEPTAKTITSLWEERVRQLYDPKDLARGHIEVPDRQGRTTRFPPMTISIGIASNNFRTIASELEMADIAAEMKQKAKSHAGSNWAMDRRHRASPENAPPEAPERELLLVVDDEPDVRTMVRIALEETYEILEAGDGMEAYLIATNRRPRWVLLDYMMPELNGRFAADLIREQVPEACIIAFSAALEERPGWADHLIRKNVPLVPAFEQIVETVKTTLRRSEATEQSGGPDDETGPEQIRQVRRARYLRGARSKERSGPGIEE